MSIDLELPRGYEVDTALQISLQTENTLSWYLDQLDTPPKQRCLLQKHSRTVIKISKNGILVPRGDNYLWEHLFTSIFPFAGGKGTGSTSNNVLHYYIIIANVSRCIFLIFLADLQNMKHQ